MNPADIRLFIEALIALTALLRELAPLLKELGVGLKEFFETIKEMIKGLKDDERQALPSLIERVKLEALALSKAKGQ